MSRLLVLLVALALVAAAEDLPSVWPGSVVRWHAPGTQTCHLDERSWAAQDGTCFVPIDLLRTGEIDVRRTLSDGKYEQRRLRVGAYPYAVQRLHIEDESKVDLSPEDEARAEREAARVAQLWSRGGEPRFVLPLAPPLERLPAGGRFGAKRILNGKPRSPHSGSDYSVAEGTPVLAAERGEVVLAEEHFFSGKSVFLDHGGGLWTLYFHLAEILVTPGQQLERGQLLGKVGSTGRATGPHLHFGVRWQGARVDPALLLGAVENMPEMP